MMSAAARSAVKTPLTLNLPRDRRGARLDQVLAALLPSLSRAMLQRLIRGGHVSVAGGAARAAYRVRGGERVVVDLPEPEPSRLEPEARPLRILHEDEDLVILDKPAGVVVHPGAGARRGTLVHFLLHHCRDLSGIGGEERPGIVHRLDRGTSGVIVVAKNDAAHRSLAAQFKARSVEKTYEALVWGRPRREAGTIDAPIGRHPSARIRMAVRTGGRAARSLYRLVEPLGPVSLLEVRPETGRTHQIRVHLRSIGHAVVGDRLYGGARAASVRDPRSRAALLAYSGLALHARSLAFAHPRTGERCRFEAAKPADLERLLQDLRVIRSGPGVRESPA